MGLLDAAGDQGFRSDVGRGLIDAGNRGMVAGLLGAPVDLSAGLLNAAMMGGGVLGHEVGLLGADQLPQPYTAPVGGSEWIGQKLQDGGFVSANRNPLAEFLAGMAGPGAATKSARGLAVLEDALPALKGSSGGFRSLADQLGVLYRKGKDQFRTELNTGNSGSPFQLGDTGDKQKAAVVGLGMENPRTNEVWITPEVLEKLRTKRMGEEGYTADELVTYAEQALRKDSTADLDRAKGRQFPSLLSVPFEDKLTKKRYQARMPFDTDGERFEARTVFPDGLPPRRRPKK